jgi:hypothetical protein
MLSSLKSRIKDYVKEEGLHLRYKMITITGSVNLMGIRRRWNFQTVSIKKRAKITTVPNSIH